jgi:hypothetical protein|nr:MAG TPA: hypothetical protein [Caudoviricetes sp.]
MGISVNMYTFSKYANSTGQPAGAGTSFDCVLKDTSGVINPTIALKLDMSFNVSAYNYAYIPDFKRYYFVREWTWERGLWVASLDVDVLATYKAQIGVSTQYVLRSSLASNGKILDTIYPTTSDITHQRVAVELPWKTHLEDGYYVVGIIGDANNTLGAVNYYAFTQSEMNDFNKALMASADWLNVPTEEISTELLKALYNPYQYVVSALWFPIVIPLTEAPAVASINFGWWSITVKCRKLKATATSFSGSINIPKHPQSAARGEYLNLSPYSRYTLNFTPFGSFPLDTTKLSGTSILNYTVLIDYISGTGRLNIAPQFPDGNSPIIESVEGMCSVPIQLAQIARDYIGTTATAIASAGDVVQSAVTGNIGGAISNFASGIDSTLKAAAPQLRTSGGNGNTSNFITAPQLYCQFFNLVQEYNEKLGRPLCEARVINTIPGYIMCMDADVKTASTQTENERIKEYLEGGFYYG